MVWYRYCSKAACSFTVFSHLHLQQQYMFLLHSEQERENWISSIKKLQPKGETTVQLFGPLVSTVTLDCFKWSFSLLPVISLPPSFPPSLFPSSLLPPQPFPAPLSLTSSLPAVRSVSFNPLELQDLLNHQTISELKKIEEVTQPVLGQFPSFTSPSLLIHPPPPFSLQSFKLH